jgi:hypothetical protein
MRLVAAALLVLLAACGGEEETVCTVQNLDVFCCQPATGEPRCHTVGQAPGCRDTVIQSVSWVGACP